MPLLALQISCKAENHEGTQQKEPQANQQANQQAHQKKQPRATKGHEQEAIRFIEKYGADKTWISQIKRERLTTYQLQQTLIRENGQPIFLMGNLLNVEQRGSTVTLFFYVPAGTESIQTEHVLIFELSCPAAESQVSALIVDDFDPWEDPKYFVAARVHSVTHARQFVVTKEHLELNKMVIEHTAQGQCIGLQAIGTS
ncbi:MAG: hypothetical protein OEY28_09010 [Nitrospira sp.]|nr:hypothetical protein [Nitrospira sp.]